MIKINKKITVVLVLILALTNLSVKAQKLKLDSFEETTELSALQYPVNDNNGVKCALVKVGIVAENPRFEGVFKFEKKDGEYWVYIPENFEQFLLKTDNYVPLNCKFEPVKSGYTYRAIILQDGNRGGDGAEEINIDVPGTGQSISLVKVNPGMFEMGATQEQASKEDDEKPAHWVRISRPFFIALTEVTQALWEAVMGTNPSVFVEPAKPVENISWADAQLFINKLNQMTGKTFAMPTEAQWEYAARGGHKSSLYRYSGSNDSQEVGWSGLNSMNRSHDVGKLKPNEIGVYDMSGNVWELCRDYKGPYPKGNVTDPEATSGKERVRRGGAWNSDESQLRNAYRRRVPEKSAMPDTGLRLIME